MPRKLKDKPAEAAAAKDLAYLLAQNVNDPDVELFYGIVSNDINKVSAALKKGASQDATLSEVLQRHRGVLDGRGLLNKHITRKD